jgi:hypothetical protein
MATFEIHGDDENGVAITCDGRTRLFDIRIVRDFPFIDPAFEVARPWEFGIPQPVTLEMLLWRRPEETEATPTRYGEGTWMH